MRALKVRRVALPFLLLLSAPAARAGTIEVLVRERDGGVVPNQQVDLLRVEPERDLEAARLFSPTIARATTDAHGRAVFEGIGAGSYTASPGTVLNAALFFADTANPLRSVGAATLAKPADRGTLEIVLDRGAWVSFEVLFDGTPFPLDMAVTMQKPGSPSARLRLDDRGRGTTQLAAGSWTFVLEHPAGLTLARAEVDGTGVDPLHVAVEIETPSSQRQLVFTLQAPCKVFGTVLSTTSPRPSVHVEAALVRPGSVPGATLVSASLDEHNAYVLFLPDGVWSIRPAGTRLLDSVPAETTLTLAVGQEGRADFSVREREAGDDARLMVVVLDPEGRQVPGATVEAWPPADLHPVGGGAAASARTEAWGGAAALVGLPAGSHRIVAGARGIGTGSLVVSDYEPKEGSVRRVVVTLRRGATVRARAVDESGAPVAGVVLRLTAAQLPEVDGFSSEGSAVCTSARAHALPTGRDGGAVVWGVAPGRWSATGESPGGTSIVQVSVAGGARKREAELSVDAGETVEIDLRVERAASVVASLRCDDRGPLPARVATRLAASAGEPAERTLDLGGERRDRIALGPLEPGDYRLAVRPEGFDGWTFAPGVEAAEDASPIHVDRAEVSDAGALVLRCEPQVRLALSVRSDQPLPDLHRAAVSATWLPGVEGAGEPVPIPFELVDGRVVLRPVPAGVGKLDVTVRHPFFLPGGEARGSFSWTLARGNIVSAPVAVAAIGGEIVARGGVAARLATARGESRIETAVRGAVSFPALEPGRYRVDVCADARCVRVVRAFDSVAVAAGATSEIDAASPP